MKLTPMIAVLSAVSLLAPDVAAKESRHKQGEPISANSTFELTESQRDELIRKANAGDNEAAARLGFFYDFTTRDRDAAYYWFRKAALNGHVQTQYNLGVRTLGTSRPDKCTEAKYWFAMAIQNGMAKAQESLDRLGDCSAQPQQSPKREP